MPNRWDNPAVFLQSGDPNTENTPVLSYRGILGAHFTIRQPSRGSTAVATSAGFNKTYQLVQSDSTMSQNPGPGLVAWWSDKTKYLVTTTVTTLGRGRVAGIFQTNVTPGNYCCVQTNGPGLVKFVDSPTAAPTAAGLIVIPSSTNGKADCLAAGSAATYPIIGYSASAILGSDSTATVDLDIPATSE